MALPAREPGTHPTPAFPELDAPAISLGEIGMCSSQRGAQMQHCPGMHKALGFKPGTGKKKKFKWKSTESDSLVAWYLPAEAY